MNKKNVGDLIAYWNVEHTKADRKKHFDKILEFVKITGLDEIFDVKDVSFPCFDSKPSEMGYPATRIDLVLKTPYRNEVYRHSDTKDRLKDLSVIHLVFRKQAGVYDCNRYADEVLSMTLKCASEKTARKITNWQGWDDFVCEYAMMTNGKYYRYKCQSCSDFSGETAGDSFNYAENWDDVHNKVFDAVYRIVHKFGIGRQ